MINLILVIMTILHNIVYIFDHISIIPSSITVSSYDDTDPSELFFESSNYCFIYFFKAMASCSNFLFDFCYFTVENAVFKVSYVSYLVFINSETFDFTFFTFILFFASFSFFNRRYFFQALYILFLDSILIIFSFSSNSLF